LARAVSTRRFIRKILDRPDCLRAVHGFLLARFAERYSRAHDFAMSTDDVAISGIAIEKPNPDGLKEFLIKHFSAQIQEAVQCAFWVDIVAKVFLRGGTQILRPVGAAIEQ
jgi:hypothetical protein